MLKIIHSGPQTTLQGAPRTNFRHLGMPWAGAADPWSMALANRLVANTPNATAIEITYGGFQAQAEADLWVGLAGSTGGMLINGKTVAVHQTLNIKAGDTINILPSSVGMRAYLSVANGFGAETVMGSTSTYLPASIGGHQGRTLRNDDRIEVNPQPKHLPGIETPLRFRPTFTDSVTLRAYRSAETNLLSTQALKILFAEIFTAGRQATRMGLSLEGYSLDLNSNGTLKSGAVFPGTIQCPENGTPIVLLADAQTTGGYARIAQVARCDRHVLGQIRPGNRIRLLERTIDGARADQAEKTAFLREWIPAFKLR